MLETYFKRGAIFQWARPRNPIVPPDGTLVDSANPATVMTYIGTAADLGFGTHMEPAFTQGYRAANGMNPGMQVRYKWLDYQPGRTARIQIRNRNVLTGPMSGCPILRWQAGGITWVGHVGTIFGNAAVNALVRAAIQPQLPPTATGFNPAGAWPYGDLAANIIPGKPFGAAEVLAFVTSHGRFYATAFHSVSGKHDMKWCAGSRLVPPLQGAALTALLT